MTKVWIDQDLCTGDGICTDHCPDVFVILEDGIAYVREDGVTLNDPGGARSPAQPEGPTSDTSSPGMTSKVASEIAACSVLPLR